LSGWERMRDLSVTTRLGLAATVRLSEKQRRVVRPLLLACCVCWRVRRVRAVGRPRGRRKGGIGVGGIVVDVGTRKQLLLASFG
jgi:hypothetical protein